MVHFPQSARVSRICPFCCTFAVKSQTVYNTGKAIHYGLVYAQLFIYFHSIAVVCYLFKHRLHLEYAFVERRILLLEFQRDLLDYQRFCKLKSCKFNGLFIANFLINKTESEFNRATVLIVESCFCVRDYSILYRTIS